MMDQLRHLLEDAVSTPVSPLDPRGLIDRGRRRRRAVLVGRLTAGVVSLALVLALITLGAAPVSPSIAPVGPVGPGTPSEVTSSVSQVEPTEGGEYGPPIGAAVSEAPSNLDTGIIVAPEGSGLDDAPSDEGSEPVAGPTVGTEGPLISVSPAPSPSPPSSGPDNCTIDAETTECRYTARSAGGYRVFAEGQWTLTIIRGHETVREIHSETAGGCGEIGIIQPGDRVWLEEGSRTGPTKVSTETTPHVSVGADHGC